MNTPANGDCTREAKCGRGAERSRFVSECGQHGADDRRGDEQHPQEQEAAAEKHGCKEAILALAELVANDADEPQKGDSGERQQIERELNDARVRGDPRARGLRIGGDRAPKQSEARQGQQRKDDAGDGGGLRGFQSGLGEAVDLAHTLNSFGGRSS